MYWTIWANGLFVKTTGCVIEARVNNIKYIGCVGLSKTCKCLVVNITGCVMYRCASGPTEVILGVENGS